VQREGNDVRITAKLINGADGLQVWTSGNLKRRVESSLALQEEIAGLIAKELSLKLGVTSAAATAAVNPQAFELYLQGRQAWNLRTAESLNTAEQCFNQAIALDRNFARAYAGLADVWLQRSVPDSGEPAQRRKIVEQIQTALRLEPDLAEAHVSLGHIYLVAQPYEEAEKELRTAIRLNPNYVLAHQTLARALEADGRLEEAFTSYQRALELDPLTSRIADNYGRALLMAGRVAEALAAFQRAVRLQPDNWQARCWLAWTLGEVGRTPDAVVEARGLASTLKDAQVAGTHHDSMNAIFAGIVLHRAGLKSEAEDVSRRMPAVRQPVHAMLLLMSRGDDPLATPFEGIVPANNLALLYYLPAFDPLRGDPRFQRLIANAGLEKQYARAGRTGPLGESETGSQMSTGENKAVFLSYASQDAEAARRMDVGRGSVRKSCGATKRRDLGEFAKRVEDFQTRSPEIFFVAGRDGQIVPAGGGRDVAVFERHFLSGAREELLVFGPHVGDGDVKADDPAVHGVGEPGQPRLQGFARPAFLAANPKGQLGDHHRARVARVLFDFEPRDDARVAVFFRRLAQHVGVEEPAHSLRRLGNSRRRVGKSARSTGQALRTFNQSAFTATRRKTSVSSSASNSALKWSPGWVGTNVAGRVRRRLASSVRIMVGLSHGIGFRQETTSLAMRAKPFSSAARRGAANGVRPFDVREAWRQSGPARICCSEHRTA